MLLEDFLDKWLIYDTDIFWIIESGFIDHYFQQKYNERSEEFVSMVNRVFIYDTDIFWPIESGFIDHF